MWHSNTSIPPYPLTKLSKISILSLQKIQNNALRFVYDEKHPYTGNSGKLHQTAKFEAVNLKVFERGLHVKNRLLSTITDSTYGKITADNCNVKHGWFKKLILHLNKGRPRQLTQMENTKTRR